MSNLRTQTIEKSNRYMQEILILIYYCYFHVITAEIDIKIIKVLQSKAK